MRNEIRLFDANFHEIKFYNDNQITGGVSYKANLNGANEFPTIGAVVSQEIKFTVFEDFFNNPYIFKNGKCEWKVQWLEQKQMQNRGLFYIESVKRVGSNKLEITAYDMLSQMDKIIVDQYIENTTYPITIYDFTYKFFEYLYKEGLVPDLKPPLLNFYGMDSFIVKDNFRGTNITARQLLQYIAQICGGFFSVNNTNKIILSRIDKEKSYGISSFEYKNLKIDRKPTATIGQVNIKMNQDDLGVSYPPSMPSEINSTIYTSYQITNNPLLYAETEEEILPVAKSLYDYLSKIVYYTGSFEVFCLISKMDLGSFYSINNDYLFLTSSIEVSQSGIKIKSNGVSDQKMTGTRNPDILALRGKTNELTRDIQKTESKLTDKYNGLENTFTQTAESLTTEIKKANDTASEAKQTADGFSTRIETAEGNASSAVQKADSIRLTVSSKDDGTTFELRNNSALLSSGNIEIKGAVKFTDLSTSGSTQINGANITSGKIKAEFVEVGAIKATTLYGSDGTKKAIESVGSSLNIGGDAGFYDYQYINLYSQEVRIKPYGDSYTALIIRNFTPTYAIYSKSTLFTIGTSAYNFNDGYFTQLHIGGYKLSQSAGKLQFDGKDVASSTNKFTDGIYLDNSSSKLTASGGKLKFGSKEIAFADGGSGGSISQLKNGSYKVDLNSSGNLIPGGTSQILGSSTYYWKQIFVEKISFDSSNNLTEYAGDLKYNNKKVLCEGDSFGVKKLKDSIYELTLQEKTLFPNYTGFSLGTQRSYYQELYINWIWFKVGYGFKKMMVNSSNQVVISDR